MVWEAMSIGSSAQGSYYSVCTTAQFCLITKGTEPTGLEPFAPVFTLQSVCALSQQDGILSCLSFHPPPSATTDLNHILLEDAQRKASLPATSVVRLYTTLAIYHSQTLSDHLFEVIQNCMV